MKAEVSANSFSSLWPSYIAGLDQRRIETGRERVWLCNIA